jgi:hypothetical protein
MAIRFRSYETGDGLLIPASIFDEMNIKESEKEKQSATASHPAAHKSQRHAKPQPAKSVGDKKKKDIDDRQIKLLDDE